MSKSLRNYPDVNEVFDRDGSDAMRWFLMSSPILRGGNLVVTETGIRDGVRQVILPLWNVWYFFATYANTADGTDGVRSGYQAKPRHTADQVLDQYLLAKTHDLIRDYAAAMDNYDIWAGCSLIRDYLDMLTNWYVRRSRRRFWDGSDEVQTSFDVLYTCLEALLRVGAPLLPFVTEEIWRGLTGGRSIHLTDYPEARDFPSHEALVVSMDRARAVCSAASSLRKAHNLRVRLPLSRLIVVSDVIMSDELCEIIADELNVRTVSTISAEEAAAAGFSMEQRLSVNAWVAGPRLGKDVQKAIVAAKAGDWNITDGAVQAGGVTLEEGEYTLEEIAHSTSDTIVLASMTGGFVALDIERTPELEAEGTARDMVRAIQNARKEANLNVSDRIHTTVTATSQVIEALETHRNLVQEETLSTKLELIVSADTSDMPTGQPIIQVTAV